MGGEGGERLADNVAQITCHLKQELTDSELEPDPDLDQIKYSSEFHPGLGSVAGGQLLGYDRESPSTAASTASGSNGVPESGAVSRPPSHSLQEATSGKRRLLAADPHTLQAKKRRLEAALSHMHPPSPTPPVPLTSPFSPPPLPQTAPYTPPSFQHPPTHYHSHQYSHPGSLVNSPESYPPSVYNSHTNTPYATPHVTPHATPHATPHGTPVPSPLPSPTTTIPPLLHTTPPLQPYPPTSSLLTPLSLPTFSPRNNLLLSQSSGTVFLNSSAQMPFRVLPVPQPILPFMASFPSFTPPVQSCATNITAGPSPFSVVPIPSSATRSSRLATQVGPGGEPW